MTNINSMSGEPLSMREQEKVQQCKREIERITQLLNQNEIERGLVEARALAKQNQNSIEVLDFWANVEEQLGSIDKAIVALRMSIIAKPTSPISYLSLGCLLASRAKQGSSEDLEAQKCFSIVLDLVPEWFFQLQALSFSERVKQKIIYAGTRLVQLFDKINAEAIGSSASVSRISKAIWPQTHLRQFKYEHETQRPHLFYIPGLRASKYWTPQKFSWAEQLEKAYSIIVNEFKHAHAMSKEEIRPYLDSHFQKSDGLENLAGQQSWTALDLYKEGKCSPFAEKYFPETLSLLKNLPLCGKGELPDEVFFSILQPGQQIPPHYGLSNHSLTVHLGIDVPGGELTVSEEKYYWKNAEVVIFDDSFLHSAKNDSDQVRVVLLFSIWHPDLSNEEILAIQRVFNRRESWFANRVLETPEEIKLETSH